MDRRSGKEDSTKSLQYNRRSFDTWNFHSHEEIEVVLQELRERKIELRRKYKVNRELTDGHNT